MILHVDMGAFYASAKERNLVVFVQSQMSSDASDQSAALAGRSTESIVW